MTMAFLIIEGAMMSSEVGKRHITPWPLTCELVCSCPQSPCTSVRLCGPLV